MEIVTFLRKKGDTTKRVVDFPLKRDTVRNTIMEIVKDFDEKSDNNNGKPLEIVKDFACESIFHFFLIFHHFLHFFIFLYFLSFSFIFFFFVLCSKPDFWSLNFVTISLDNSHVKNQFLGPSWGRREEEVHPLGPLFLFSLLFSPVFCLFSCFLFSFFSFFVHFFIFYFVVFFIFFFHFF